MHEDMGHLFSIGAVVSSDVVLVDGAAEGWPGDVLVDTQVVIEDRPAFALHGSLARTPQLSACWRGENPVGSRFSIPSRPAGGSFHPAVSQHRDRRRPAHPDRDHANGPRPTRGVEPERHVAPRRCTGVAGRWLAPTGPDPGTQQEVGFLVALDVASDEIRPFPERPTDTTSLRLPAGPTLPQ